MLGRLVFLFFLFLSLNFTASCQSKDDLPNIVWLVSEDNSKHWLQLYDSNGVAMPNIEWLATNGIVFENAISQAPVCSVARSTIISGCYAPRLGVQYHRRAKKVPLPKGLKMFPAYLKEAGYYTTNNSKEDYNFIKPDGVWDESSKKATYQNRKEGQPFFHVQNFGITHEGQLHFPKEEITSTLDSITLFPYHPPTSIFNYTYQKYFQKHQQLDQQIGAFLQQLEADGLLEETIIFYYGDHGGVLPRSKGYVYESGLHVPMVVYFPEKWQHLAPAKNGSRLEGMVRFIDLAPTVLHLAGIDIPAQIDGLPFLGTGISATAINQRNTAFSYADRFDEKYDLVRAIRKGKYKYIRNYQPFNVDGLYNFYRYRMLAYQNWREGFKKNQLNPVEKMFFQERPAESLYDLEEDPHEIHDLAESPAYDSILQSLRTELHQKVISLPDLSFFPEPYFLTVGSMDPVAFGQAHKNQIKRMVEIADLSLQPFSEVEATLRETLESRNPWDRYWALIVCSSFGAEAHPFQAQAKKLTKTDPENLVRVRAAEFLMLLDGTDQTDVFLKTLENAQSVVEANLILNTVALLKDLGLLHSLPIQESQFNPEWIKDRNVHFKERIKYLKD